MDASTVRRGWAERVGEFSPRYYAALGPNKVSRSLVTVLDHYLDSDAAILELGCSSGRHLAHLQANGYDTLTGIDINDESFAVMAEYYPALADAGTFHTGALERLLPDIATDAFDVVYSVETLQHVHPDDTAVFADIARITDGVLVTVENEGGRGDDGEAVETVQCADDSFPLYYRDWQAVFTGHGLVQHLCKPSSRDTIRVFQ